MLTAMYVLVMVEYEQSLDKRPKKKVKLSRTYYEGTEGTERCNSSLSLSVDPGEWSRSCSSRFTPPPPKETR